MFAINYNQIADIYDLYANQDFDVPFFLEEAAQTSGPVLELMSGTGRMSLPLLRQGLQLTCLDASQEMLDRLKQKLSEEGLSAQVVCADIRSFTTEHQHTLALIPFHSLMELLSEQDQLAALKSIQNSLIDGGRLIVTLHNPPVRARICDGCLRISLKCEVPGGCLLVSACETLDAQTSIVTRHQFHELFDHQGNLCGKRWLEMRFRLIDQATFESLSQQAGFKTVALYGDYSRSGFDPITSPHQIWVLEKR